MSSRRPRTVRLTSLEGAKGHGELCESKKTRRGPCARDSNSKDLMGEKGAYPSVQTTAIKRLLATQLAQAMKDCNLTKFEMARKMRTSDV
jgi:hypothetical protein